MGRTNKLWSTTLCLVALVMGGGVVWAASPRTAWLSAAEPIIEKVAELPENLEPPSLNHDCTPTQLPNGSSTIDSCAYKTPIGTIAGGMLLDGPKGTYPYDQFYGGFILPSIPNRPNTIVTSTISNGVNAIRLGAYDPAQLKFAEYYGGKKVYEYRGQPSTTIKIPGDSGALSFNASGVAYSSNGDWLVGVVRGKGIFRYDLTALQGKLIAWDAASYTYGFGYKNTNNLAVSDDGRFVAITFSVPNGSSSRPSLRVYDTQACRDQYPNFLEPTKHNGCEYKDYWTGEYRTGNTRGIRDVLPTAEYPRRVRFTGIDTLTFDTIYDRTGPSAYKVARYSLRVPTTTSREYVSVLGMGDSYISGEGAAGTYSAGTDTKQNKCHLSWFSYPYRAGAQAFQYGHSVACSGATMFDVSMAAGDPETDPEKKVTREDDYLGQVINKKRWEERNQVNTIKSFSPGYAQQVVFAREYKPRTILLSVGGNDVAFAKILATCVAGEVAGTCYHYYEDRVQLMEQILGQYERLVKTYKSVLAESGGARVYVVGYPQILKEGGACGANVHFNAAEVQFGARLITYLNSVIKRAAAEAGVYYVDTESALNGYRLCEAPKNNAGVNGLTTGDDKGVKVQAHAGGKTYSKTIGIGNESYHPTALGHRLLAQRVISSTTNLTAPMPAPKANNKPSLDYTSSLLKDVEHAPEQQRHREAIKWSDAGDISVLLKNSPYKTNAPKGTIKQGTSIKGVLRSNPVTLFEGIYDETKGFVFTIPDYIPVGLHTFDIYGVTPNGDPIDLREVVYVAEETDDFDGDGTPNEQEACVLVGSLGIDQDNDGADDACDSELRDISINDSVPELPSRSPIAFDPDENTGTPGGSQSIVVPYIPPEYNANENDSSQPKTTATRPTGSSNSLTNTNNPTSTQPNPSLPPYFGYVLTPPGIDLQNGTDVAATAATNVLGKKTDMPEKPNRQATRGENTITLIALATTAFVTLFVLTVFRSRRG
ncbi:SGNH/GDSL hydrolase family protein [Candidatus Saccharibacteria bacterium]|nr:MAG: SGNH/GDSL hydrolase family protein [Candidatus Saccharibacteria bacterium]